MKNVLFGKSKIAFFVVCAALIFCVLSQSAYCQKIKKYKPETIVKISDDLDADEFQIFVLVNAQRTQRGLQALVLDDDVADIARDYSKKMAKENFFSHYDADGNSIMERAKAARLKHWIKIGENLFSVENVVKFDAFAVKNWMNSPAHRQNILDRDWTTTGIGIAKSKAGEIFITQVFIRR